MTSIGSRRAESINCADTQLSNKNPHLGLPLLLSRLSHFSLKRLDDRRVGSLDSSFLAKLKMGQPDTQKLKEPPPRL